MKRQSYMANGEMCDWLKLGVLAGEAEDIAKRTPEKDWHRKLATVATLTKQIVQDRLNVLDPKQLESVHRRSKGAHIMLKTTDDFAKKGDEEVIEVSLSDFTQLALHCAVTCDMCDEKCADQCAKRAMFHRLGFEVLNCEPEEGHCEFHSADKSACEVYD